MVEAKRRTRRAREESGRPEKEERGVRLQAQRERKERSTRATEDKGRVRKTDREPSVKTT